MARDAKVYSVVWPALGTLPSAVRESRPLQHLRSDHSESGGRRPFRRAGLCGHGAGTQRVAHFADGWYRGFAPRVGGASTLTPKTVMRGSVGLYYAPGTSAQITQFGFASSPSYVSSDGFTPVYNWNTAGFPASPLPPFIDPSFQNGQPVGTFQRDAMRAPQILSWTYSIQRQLSQNTALDLTYIGSHSTHLSTGPEFSADQHQCARSQIPGSRLAADAAV